MEDGSTFPPLCLKLPRAALNGLIHPHWVLFWGLNILGSSSTRCSLRLLILEFEPNPASPQEEGPSSHGSTAELGGDSWLELEILERWFTVNKHLTTYKCKSNPEATGDALDTKGHGVAGRFCDKGRPSGVEDALMQSPVLGGQLVYKKSDASSSLTPSIKL